MEATYDSEMSSYPVSSGKNFNRRRRRRQAKARKAQVEPMVMTTADSTAPKKQHDAPMTKSDIYFALDCEMVGVGAEGLSSVVARVTIVNWENVVVLDTFVKVQMPVTDYRTHISGITSQDIESDNAMSYEQVRENVKNILHGKILIGHGLENDLIALGLTHPWSDVRDTACYSPYMQQILDPPTGELVARPRKLRDLTWEVLGRQIQQNGRAHCPVEDAIASLDLYKAARYNWEAEMSRQQRERAVQEAEKEERRFKYNFLWTSHATGVFHPCEPHSVHLLPIPLDPRLAHSDPYGNVSMGGYPTMAPPPPPPPPSPQQMSTNPSSSWWIFRRPKTPPMSAQNGNVRKGVPSPSPTTSLSTSTEELVKEEESIATEDDQAYPEIQFLSLDSTTSQETWLTGSASVVTGGLPFYSRTSIWNHSNSM